MDYFNAERIKELEHQVDMQAIEIKRLNGVIDERNHDINELRELVSLLKNLPHKLIAKYINAANARQVVDAVDMLESLDDMHRIIMEDQIGIKYKHFNIRWKESESET